jgi:glycine hydroxymethyltransferase
MSELKDADLEVYNAIKGEEERERTKIVLIASENYVSQAVLEAQASAWACPTADT